MSQRGSKASTASNTGGNDAAREKALTAALGEIEKAYGKGAIMRLGDGQDPVGVPGEPGLHPPHGRGDRTREVPLQHVAVEGVDPAGVRRRPRRRPAAQGARLGGVGVDHVRPEGRQLPPQGRSRESGSCEG